MPGLPQLFKARMIPNEVNIKKIRSCHVSTFLKPYYYFFFLETMTEEGRPSPGTFHSAKKRGQLVNAILGRKNVYSYIECQR